MALPARAGAELLLKVAHLGFAFGACAETVSLVATFRRCKLDAVCLGYLPTYLFQYLAGLLSSCHSQSVNLNVIGKVNQYSTAFPFRVAGLNLGRD